MEVSVRYVQVPNAGQKPALCFRGENLALAVINDAQAVRTLTLTLKDYDKAAKVKKAGQDYLTRPFAESLIENSKKKAITRLASYLVYSIKEDCVVHEQNLYEPEDKLIMPKNEDPGDIESLPAELPTEPKVRKLPKRVSGGKEAYAIDPDPFGLVSGKGITFTDPRKKTVAPGSADPPKGGLVSGRLPGRGTNGLKIGSVAKQQAKPKRESTKTLVSVLAAEAGIAQQPCRVKLRAAGLRAPYDERNEAACRKALGLPAKGKK